jgi:hypothetical protein
LGKGGLRLRAKLINSMCESGEWPKYSTDITMNALKKDPKTRKCCDHRTVSAIAHATKIIARTHRRKIEKNTEDVSGEDHFGFRTGKGARDAPGMLRVISDRTLDIVEELCACFIDWQKAFGRIIWIKLMHIVKSTGINWAQEDWLANCTRISVELRLNQGQTRRVKTGRGFRQEYSL